MVVSWREVKWNGRWGKTSEPNSFNFWNIGCVTCGQVFLWKRTGPFLLTKAGCSFQGTSSICWAYFSDGMVSPGFRKLQWIRPAADHQTVTLTFFGTNLALGSALELLLGPATELVIAGWCIKSTFVTHHNLIEKWFVIVVQNKRRPDFKMMIFLIFGQLMRHSLIEPFHLSNLLQMLNDHIIVDAEFLDNFLCSCRSFSDPLNWSLSTSRGRPLCSSSSRLSSPLQNFLN